MKKVFYLVIMLFVTALSVQSYAADVFYVKSDGQDTNAGTEDAPWRTLNPNRWTDGCTVVILSDIYMGNEIDIPQIQDGAITNITIKGASANLGLMGLSDDEFEEGEEYIDFRFFRVDDDVVLNLENITLKNVRMIDNNGPGGLVMVGPFGTLNTDNVTFKNSHLTTGASGGAINHEGTLHAKNSVFENCVAAYGGVVNIIQTEEAVKAIFDNCTFKNNSTEVLDGGDGGAFKINANLMDLSFNGCYFESNHANTYGGAFHISDWTADCNVNLSFNSTVFANNTSVRGCGIMFARRAVREGESGVINFSAINNVMYHNYSETGAHSMAWNIDGGNYPEGLQGSYVFVNNTSIRNNNDTGSQSSYFTVGWGPNVEFVFVNNILLDTNMEEVRTGWGFVVEESRTEAANPYRVFKRTADPTNNIHDGFGGSGDVPGGFIEYVGGGNGNTFVSRDNFETMEALYLAIGLDTELTVPANGSIPYMELIDEYGLAVDGGINSVSFNGANIIPAVDIRGAEKVGVKDIGSFEYGGVAPGVGIKENSVAKVAYAYPSPFTDVINLSSEAASVKIYNVTGICCLSAQNVSSVDASALASGIYIVKIVDKTGKTVTQKVKK